MLLDYCGYSGRRILSIQNGRRENVTRGYVNKVVSGEWMRFQVLRKSFSAADAFAIQPLRTEASVASLSQRAEHRGALSKTVTCYRKSQQRGSGGGSTLR